MVPDGDRGAFIAWADQRAVATTQNDVYLARLSKEGGLASGWAAGGTPVCTVAGNQQNPALVQDASGGVYVVWEDGRPGDGTTDIYAQRFDASGVAYWEANGVPVSTETGSQLFPRIVDDSPGGAIIAWQDQRFGAENPQIFMQRIDVNGSRQWPVQGVDFCGPSQFQTFPRLAADGQGGAYVVWTDNFNNMLPPWIAMGRIPAGGIPEWCAYITPQDENPKQFPTVTLEPQTGRALVAWEQLDPGGQRIYAQAVASDGALLLDPPTGVRLSASESTQHSPAAAASDESGVIVGWIDDRSSPGAGVYAQRISSMSVPPVLWDAAGVAAAIVDVVSTQLVAQSGPDGGVILSWTDADRGTTSPDIFAIALDPLGALGFGWVANGSPVCDETGDQNSPVICSDGFGGALIAWEDLRNPSTRSVFAQHITSSGVRAVDVPLPQDAAVVRVVGPHPNPTTSTVTLVFSLQRAGVVSVDIVDLAGRHVGRVFDAFVPPGGDQLVRWDLRRPGGGRVLPGVYFLTVAVDGRRESRRFVVVR
jgi:hypothetical protein